jgi:hypothetical protein
LHPKVDDGPERSMLGSMKREANESARGTPSRRARLDRHGLVIEDAAHDECLRFDLEGRWLAWHRGGTSIRRGILYDAYLGRTRRPVRAPPATTLSATEAIAERARELRRDLLVGTVAMADGTAIDDVLEALRRAARWTATRHEAARAEASIVHPDGIPILPPHRRRDVIVEPARGCPNGRCSFCAFYRGRGFEILDDASFDAHLARVTGLWGAALSSRDGVFLGSASAASLPDRTLERRLARIRAVLGRRTRAAAGFLDPDRAPRRDRAAWARLREAGLVDVTAGLETGDSTLRAATGKRGDVEGFAGAIAAAKAGGMRVSGTVLLGLGGVEAADRHREASAAAVATMRLDERDFVYLSPLEGALAPDRLAAEIRAWRAGLAVVTPARVAVYGADAFVALA